MVTQKRSWKHSTRAAPELLTQMVNDIGLGDGCIARALVARHATLKFCRRQIQITDREIEMGELSRLAGAFYDGYISALNDGGEASLYPLDSVLGSIRSSISVFDDEDPWEHR